MSEENKKEALEIIEEMFNDIFEQQSKTQFDSFFDFQNENLEMIKKIIQGS